MQATDTVTVAVRPNTGTGTPADWRTFDVTLGSLSHPEDIGEEIYVHLRAENPGHYGYHANIAIMVSPDVPGYPAGCSVHTEHHPYNGYTASDYRRAWREHWNCEHDRFGTPAVDPDAHAAPKTSPPPCSTEFPTPSRNGTGNRATNS